MPPLHYRLKIRNAADSADELVIATDPSETHPYVLTTPEGDGESFDPLTGAVEIGGYSIQIIDAPHGSGSRVLTRVLTDASRRWQLLGHKALLQVSDTDPLSWGTFLTGYVTRLEQVDALAFEVEIGETRYLESRHEVWRTVTTQFDRPSCIVGGPVRGGFAGFPDLGGWRFKVSAVAAGGTGTGYVRLSLVRAFESTSGGSWGAGVSTLLRDAMVKRANRRARDYLVKDGRWLTSVGTRAWYPRLNVRLENPATGALVGHFNPLDTPWIADVFGIPVGAPGGLLGITGTPRMYLDWTGTGGQPAQPAVNTEYNVYVFPVDVSDKNPLHVEGHPLDIHTLAYDEAGITWDAASKATVRAIIGDDEWVALRPTNARTVEALTRMLQQLYGYATRIGSNGERVFISTRVRANSAPATTIGINDLRAEGSPLTLDVSRAVTSFGIRHQQFFAWDENIDEGERPADGIVVVPHERIADMSAPVPLAGQDIRVDIPGQIMTRTPNGAVLVDLEAKTRGIGRELDDRYGRGPWEMTLHLRRGVAVALGEEVTVSVPFQVNADATPADRGGSRIMQVVHRTPVDEGLDIDLVDSGTSSQVPTAPTFTLAADTADPKRTIIATITNAATLATDGSLVRVEVTTSAGARGLVTIVDPASTTTIRLGPFDSGTNATVGMRAERPNRRPSAYATASLDLADLSPVTALTRAGRVLSWTLGETSAMIEVMWKQLADAAYIRAALLPPGSRAFEASEMPGGVDAYFLVRHRDPMPFNGKSADAALSFTMPADTIPQAPTAPSIWAGTPDERGVPRMDGTYGYDVTAQSYPGDVEFEVALETSVGSNTPGTYESVQLSPAVPGGRVRYRGLAPRDGLKRYVRAWGVLNGVRSAASSTVLSIDPWSIIVRPRTGGRNTINFVTATGGDDGYALRASDPAGRESDLSLFISATETLKVGTVATPATIPKTYRFHAHHLVPRYDSTTWEYSSNGVHSRTINVTADFVGIVQLPPGVTLTGWRIRGKRLASTDQCEVALVRTDDAGSGTTLGTIALAANGSGYQTSATSSLSEVISSSNAYVITAAVKGSSILVDGQLLWIEFDYGMPDYAKTI